MTKNDLYASIPNQEGVDKVMIDRAWNSYVVLERFEEQITFEPLTLEEPSREGDMRTKANPFWKDYHSAAARFQSAMAELGLTPKGRKQLQAKQSSDSTIPKLKKRTK